MAGSATSTTGSSRGFEYVENEDNFDRISNLPENLLSQILSLLPTKEAVASSILSKRWRFLWTTITNIDISFHNERNSPAIVDFMNRVLLQRNHPSINKFCLSVCEARVNSLFNKWISVVGRRQVKHFKLEVGAVFEDYYIVMPCRSLFDCKKLEVLILCGSGIFFNIPKEVSICFPSLKVLHLEYVLYGEISTEESSICCFPALHTLYIWRVNYFKNDGSINKILPKCPVLEVVHMRSNRDTLSNIQICAPALRRFELELYGEFNQDADCKVEIDSPVLQYVSIVGLIEELILKQIPYSLVEAKILVSDRILLEKDDADTFMTTSLFPEYTVVTAVDCMKYQVVTNVAIIGSSDLDHSLFCNLTRLALSLWCKDLSYLQSFLKRSVNLRSLFIQMVPCGFRISGPDKCCYEESVMTASGTEELGWNEFLPVPTCLISSLKHFEIVGSCGCPIEVAMTKYMIENSKVLEKVIVHVHIKGKYGDKMTELLQKISMFPRGSAVCDVEFRIVNY